MTTGTFSGELRAALAQVVRSHAVVRRLRAHEYDYREGEDSPVVHAVALSLELDAAVEPLLEQRALQTLIPALSAALREHGVRPEGIAVDRGPAPGEQGALVYDRDAE